VAATRPQSDSARAATIAALRALQHELHNALTPLGALAEVARRNPHDRQVNELAMRAAAAVPEQAARIVQSVLEAFELLPAEEEDGERPSSISRVIGDLVARRRVLQPGREYKFHVEHGLASAADGAVIEMILTNLILNAESASGPGGRIEIRGMRARDGEIELAVEDWGRGMEVGPASPVKSYNHFDIGAARSGDGALEHGGAKSTNRTIGGMKPSGVGLSICRRLLAMVGGRMKIESAVGKGTRVRVWVSEAGQ